MFATRLGSFQRFVLDPLPSDVYWMTYDRLIAMLNESHADTPALSICAQLLDHQR